jgi:biotin operon repressor
MAKSTKYFELFTALKAGGERGASPPALQKATGFNQGALAVYIHALRTKFGCQIESVRNGRTVVAYRLINGDALEGVITPARKKRAAVAKKPKTVAKKVARAPKKALRTVTVAKTPKKSDTGIVEVPDRDMEITEYNDRELMDIQAQLGIV